MADKTSGNVVQMQNYAGLTKKSGPSNSSRILQDCRNTVLDRTADALSRAMDNIDDTLFALADKASNNTLQSHYFDAMREIRIIRKDIESTFKSSFKEKSDELIKNKFSFEIQDKAPSMAEIGLSLVEDDDLEESLAINTLIDKIGTICHNELYGLDKRIGLLLGKKDLETEDNPIGPKTVCTAFKVACGQIESGVDIKIIVFKLIDRYICEAIQHVYRDINNHLAMSGILPKIPTQIGKGNHALGESIASVVVGQGSGETDFLSAFSQLVTTSGASGGGVPFQGVTGTGAAVQGSMQGMPGIFQPGVQGGGPGMMVGGGAASIMPSTLQSLTMMQKGEWEALGIDVSAIDTHAVANGTGNVLWSIKNSPLPKNAENGDEMIIEIVALLFDYIFDNKKVPVKAKALIGRLQIPVLKAAMLDNTFFSMRNHPARRLLNILAQSTVGLMNEGDDDSDLFKGISTCVQKVLDEFDTDIGVFETALTELESLLENHQSHFDENIDEAKKLMQGRERLMIAESLVIDEIERRLEDKPFPQFVRTFAMENWKNLLIVTYMKEGQESDAWKSKLEMLDLLIWSTLPKPSLKDRKKLVEMLPTLLTGIEDGMRLVSMDAREQDVFMEKLSNCHARLVNSDAQALNIDDHVVDVEKQFTSTDAQPVDIEAALSDVDSQPVDVEAEIEDVESQLVDIEAQLIDIEAQLGNVEEKEPEPIMNKKVVIPITLRETSRPPTQPAEEPNHKVGSIMVEEIKVLGQDSTSSLNENQQDVTERLDIKLNLFGEAEHANDTAASVSEIATESTQQAEMIEEEIIDDECTELVRSMVPGIWFEFHEKDGTTSMERLAWISAILGSYLFTNHDGLKTRELSTHELEQSLRDGRAVIADDLSFLVDSTFNTLLDDMQKKIAG